MLMRTYSDVPVDIDGQEELFYLKRVEFHLKQLERRPPSSQL